ncbi:unnamed protein product [Prorocentrum cordatum]|uniref:Uncharacterized protein n=1 Tax=Prorocentrum cordatum TaxID=2364126 RepID=A0ABN9T9L2_9DINO|nr:unnamed protein product [Polarella glacialis]
MQRMQWVVKKKDPGNATEKRESWADSSPLGNAEVRVEPAPAAIGSTPVRGKRRRGKFVKEDLAPDAEPAADEAEWEEEQWDWSPYVIVRDASVAVMLTRSGMRDKDLPGLFVYLEEALKKVRGSKPCHKYDVDLSDNKEITDRGVVEHLVPFLDPRHTLLLRAIFTRECEAASWGSSCLLRAWRLRYVQPLFGDDAGRHRHPQGAPAHFGPGGRGRVGPRYEIEDSPGRVP